MERRKLSGWVLPSIGDALFLSIFAVTLYMGAGLLNDGDTGWHIVTGQSIIETLKVPFSDPYSHTLPGTSWTAHEWFAEVIFAAAHYAAGLNGVVVLTAIVIGLTFFYLYRQMLFIGAGTLAAAAMTILAASASTLHWLARPHVFSFPLTLAFIVILENYQRGRTDRLKFLPLLMVLWVNVHAGYILGLMLIGLYAVGNLLIHFASGGSAEHMARFKKLSLLCAATLAATFANPHGPMILYFPFHLVGREYIMDNVREWVSPDFHTNHSFEIMLVAVISIFALSRKKPDIFEGGASLMLLHMSLYSARYIPLMALIVVPMAAGRLGGVLEDLAAAASGSRVARRIRERVAALSERTAKMQSRLGGHLWIYGAVATCVLIALNGGRLGHAELMDYTHRKDRFPVDALKFAMENDIQGKMFNNDGWGGYIIYKCYPEYRVFFDGRSDMYGVDFMKEYVKVARAELGYEDVLDKYGVDWVIYNANSPICQLLAESGKWKLVYADEVADILLRDIPRNRGLIEKYDWAKFLLLDTDDDD